MAATSGLRTFRLILWGLVILAALGATYVFFFLRVPPPGAGGIGQGDYALVEADGTPFTPATLKGAPSMLFFGYTHCPDVCPTTLSDMATWYEALGDEGKALNAYFITVDPARDTQAIMADYVSWLDGKVAGVTGSQAEVDKAVKAWGVVAEKVGEGEDYLVNHTASVFLINPDGSFRGTIAYEEDRDTAVQKLRRLIEAS